MCGTNGMHYKNVTQLKVIISENMFWLCVADRGAESDDGTKGARC